MFGAFRLFLALVVVANHLWEPVANKLGFNAVVAFYVLSGLLMTKVIHESYGTGLRGVCSFLVNRGLRVFPAYWLFLLMTLGLVMVFGNRFAVTGYIQWPDNIEDWLRNVTLIDLAWGKAVLIPPAWCLGVEVLFYILMPVVLARTATTIWLWFAVSFLITLYLVWIRADFGYRYYPAYAASLFVSLGAVIYISRSALARCNLPGVILWPLIGAFGLLPLIVEAFELDPLWLGYYLAPVLLVPILASLLHRQSADGGRIDRFAGELAFPVFMGHFLAGGIVLMLMPDSWPSHGNGFFVASLVLTLAISVVFHLSLEPPLQRLRDRVRARAVRPGLVAA